MRFAAAIPAFGERFLTEHRSKLLATQNLFPIAKAFEKDDFSADTLASYETDLREQMGAIFPMIYRWYEILRNPNAGITLFDQATRFSWLRRRVNASLVGAWEAVARDPSFKLEALMNPELHQEVLARGAANTLGVSLTQVTGPSLSLAVPAGPS